MKFNIPVNIVNKIKLYASAMRWIVQAEQINNRHHCFFPGDRFNSDEEVFSCFYQLYMKNDSELSIDSDQLPYMVENALIHAGDMDYCEQYGVDNV